MLRTIGSVILGYVVMAALVFATFTIAYLAMGSERAFQPGSYSVSVLWSVTSIVLSFGAAVAGGLVCALVGRGDRAPRMLALLVLVLGIAFALPEVTRRQDTETEPRTGAVDNLDAMQKARQPTWVAVLNPLIGATGVLAGARLRHRAPAGV